MQAILQSLTPKNTVVALSIFLTLLCTLILVEPHRPSAKDRMKSGKFSKPMNVILLLQLMHAYVFIRSMIASGNVSKVTTFDGLINDPWCLTQLISVVVCILSCLVRFRCYQNLGHMFTFSLAIRPKHKLVTDGVYSFVRHPSYTSLVVSLASYYLSIFSCIHRFDLMQEYAQLLQPLIGTQDETRLLQMLTGLGILTVAAFSAFFIHRIPQEEQMLSEEFKGRWKTYTKQTPYRFFPIIY
jgi:protein-S-isoprenylcysteine O-methyltransferase Ste14